MATYRVLTAVQFDHQNRFEALAVDADGNELRGVDADVRITDEQLEQFDQGPDDIARLIAQGDLERVDDDDV